MAQRLPLVLLASLASGLLFRLPSAAATQDSSPGFVYNGGEVGAPVQLEAFVDLTCPDSRDAWPVFTKIVDSYGADRLRLTVHLFPLPYHRNAHIAAASVFLVGAVEPSRVTEWLTVVFNNQEAVANAKTEQDTIKYELLKKLHRSYKLQYKV